ncbi:DMT family transporter [Epibacterium ulvae]|uniref:DMT family transporter n=1 Tax=Epibacterium ulvae TaxID=1156985 RepID=UPI002491B1E2|nr:DMT family transporter [Epibacterium ulvae]
MTANQKGALFMVLAMSAYTCNDAIVKLLGVTLPLSQILVLRGTSASVLLLALAIVAKEQINPRNAAEWGFVLVRGGCEVAATYFFLTALLVMPIANITAVMQALPLTVTLAAAVLFRESVGWRRLSAILIGFLGIVLIVRPGPDGFDEGTFYTLFAVLCITARDMVTRKMPEGMSSMSLAFCTSIAVTLFGATMAAGQDWQTVTTTQAGLLLTAALFILSGYLFSVLAMRSGEVSFTAPFRYSGLLVALIIGLFVFGQWPDALTLLGTAIVVGAGLFTLAREHRKQPLKRPQKPV